MQMKKAAIGPPSCLTWIAVSSLPGLTRQSIVLENKDFFSMDARVKPAHDD
jgi:hypothetical protein